MHSKPCRCDGNRGSGPVHVSEIINRILPSYLNSSETQRRTDCSWEGCPPHCGGKNELKHDMKRFA